MESVWLKECLRNLRDRLWNKGETSLDAIYDDVCRLLWLQIALDDERLFRAGHSVASLKERYELMLKCNSTPLLSGAFRLYSSQLEVIADALASINWRALDCESRFDALCDFYARTAGVGYTGGKEWLGHVESRLLNMKVFRERKKVLLNGVGRLMSMRSLLDKVQNQMLSMVVDGTWETRQIRRLLALSTLKSSDEEFCVETGRSGGKQAENFEIGYINAWSMMGGCAGAVAGAIPFGRYELFRSGLDQCYELLQPDALLLALVPKRFAALDRYAEQRNMIEKRFRLEAVFDLCQETQKKYDDSVVVVFKKICDEDGTRGERSVFAGRLLRRLNWELDVIELDKALMELDSYLSGVLD